MCTNSEADVIMAAMKEYFIVDKLNLLIQSDILKSIHHDGKIFLFKHILDCRRKVDGC